MRADGKILKKSATISAMKLILLLLVVHICYAGYFNSPIDEHSPLRPLSEHERRIVRSTWDASPTGQGIPHSVYENHECIHETMDKHEEIGRSLPLRGGAHRRAGIPANFTGMKVHIDSSLLENDVRMCQSAGQYVEIGTASGTPQTNPCPGGEVPSSGSCWYLCTSADVLTTAKKDFYEQVAIPRAKEYFSNALSVRDPKSDIKNSLSGLSCSGGTVPLSSDLQAGIGVDADTDVVLVVSARPARPGTIAYAQSCAYDTSYTGAMRPFLGHVNWSPYYLAPSEYALASQLGVMLHEVTHALGFSSGKYNYYRKCDSDDEQLPCGTYSQTRTTVTRNQDSMSKDVSFIITPHVVDAFSAHFGTAVTGGELEDSGGSGTAASHWERRAVYNEYMSGSISQYPVFSNLTMSLFEDMGWYVPNYGMAQQLVWGRESRGVTNPSMQLTFSSDRCLHQTWTDPEPWALAQGLKSSAYNCIAQSGLLEDPPENRCTFDRSGKGICNVFPLTANLDPWNQYVSGSANTGGIDTLADFCGFYALASNSEGTSDGDCALTANWDDDNSFGLGETFSSNSKCFMSTLQHKLWGSAKSSPVPACYNYSCPTPTRLRLRVGDHELECQTAGQKLSVPGFNGFIHCPPAFELCDTIRGSKVHGGAGSIADDLQRPHVTGIAPNSMEAVDVLGGVEVVISGTGFLYTPVQDGVEWEISKVTIGRGECINLEVTATSITCFTGPFRYAEGLETTVDVTVHDTLERTESLEGAMTFKAVYKKAVSSGTVLRPWGWIMVLVLAIALA